MTLSPSERLWDLFRLRHRAYALTFGGETGKAVLADLAAFCRARETTFHPDARLHAVLEGRREVWLRIAKYMNLTEAEIDALVKKNGGTE
jgi:hypothetical protein